MLLEDLHDWMKYKGFHNCDVDERLMDHFLIEQSTDFTPKEMLNYLFLQVYNLQVCTEGLIEDMEF